MTKEKLLDLAESLEFSAQLDDKGSWEIFPTTLKPTWVLTQRESRWILSVNNTPQLVLNEREALIFLKSRSQTKDLN